MICATVYLHAQMLLCLFVISGVGVAYLVSMRVWFARIASLTLVASVAELSDAVFILSSDPPLLGFVPAFICGGDPARSTHARHNTARGAHARQASAFVVIVGLLFLVVRLLFLLLVLLVMLLLPLLIVIAAVAPALTTVVIARASATLAASRLISVLARLFVFLSLESAYIAAAFRAVVVPVVVGARSSFVAAYVIVLRDGEERYSVVDMNRFVASVVFHTP